MIWRYYQKQCFNAIYNKLKAGVSSQLIVCATGTGKRAMACEVARHFKRVLFLAHREELIEQAFNELEALFPFECGIIKAERFEIDKRIIIASAQTIYRRLDNMPAEMFDLIIVDEAHHYTADSFIKPLRHFTPRLITGWSATPTRMDNLDLSNLFEEITFEYPIEKAIGDRYLCNLDGIRVKTNIDLAKVKRTAGDFNLKDLSENVDTDARNQLIVDKYIQYANGKKAIAFCVDIVHSERLAAKFIENGIAASFVHSKMDMKYRKDVIRAFKEGHIKVLCNVGILTEGWDYADVESILMARPTQSIALYLQMIGRGTRLKSMNAIIAAIPEPIKPHFNKLSNKVVLNDMVYEKNGELFFKEYLSKEWNPEEKEFLDFLWPFTECKIIDFVDNCGKHAVVNTFTLDKGKEAKDKVFLSQEKRDKILTEERKRREAKIETKFDRDKRVNLLDLPKVTYARGEWRLQPATEKQIAWLKREGVWEEGVEYTKLQASQFISNFPAPEWSVKVLERNGYDVSKGVTVGESQLAMEEIKMKNQEYLEKNPPFKV